MTLLKLIFYMLAFVILASTGLAITRRNLVHTVVYLIVSFCATATLFYLLGAPLLAALEVMIYAGAIMVLFLFIIMTMRTEDPEDYGSRGRAWIFPSILGTVLFLAVALLVLSGPFAAPQLKAASVGPAAFGRRLFEVYWLPVEIVSFLLFVALVGALYLGRANGDRRPEIGERKTKNRGRKLESGDQNAEAAIQEPGVASPGIGLK
jgi:NADH-quinone oxidoreductase subunit J